MVGCCLGGLNPDGDASEWCTDSATICQEKQLDIVVCKMIDY